MKIKLDNGDIIDGYSVSWDYEKKELILLDQRLLPNKIKFVHITTLNDTYNAIGSMAVRGAPAIGLTGVFGLLLHYNYLLRKNLSRKNIFEDIKKAFEFLLSSRPTAIDLYNMMKSFMDEVITHELDFSAAENYALYMLEQNKKQCYNIGVHGSKLIKNDYNVLTHCNAGALATADYGTALAPIRIAHYNGKSFHVWVDETRPRLQGARLTSWELLNEEISHHVIVDSAAGYFMSEGLVDLVIVGADRVTGDGWVANKIGTNTLSILAKYFEIPFYVAIPWSTFIPNVSKKDSIIEEREANELIKSPSGDYMMRKDTPIRNPAFDWTSVENVSGFITPDGIFSFKELFSRLET